MKTKIASCLLRRRRDGRGRLGLYAAAATAALVAAPLVATADVSFESVVRDPVLDVREIRDVEVVAGDAILRADRLRYNPRTGRLYTLEGAVLMAADGSVTFGETIQVEGDLYEAVMRALPQQSIARETDGGLGGSGGGRMRQAAPEAAEPGRDRTPDSSPGETAPLAAQVAFAPLDFDFARAVATRPAAPPRATSRPAGLGVQLAALPGDGVHETVPSGGDGPTLLETAIDEAVARSRSDESFRAARTAASEETEAVARDRWSPNVRLLAGSRVSAGGVGRGGIERDGALSSNAYAGVGAQMRVYDHGRNAVDREMAELDVGRAEVERRAAAARVAAEVRSAFTGARLDRVYLDNLVPLHRELEALRRTAEAQFDARLVTSDQRGDVDSVLQNLDARLSVLEQRREEAARRWRALTGRGDDPADTVRGWPGVPERLTGAVLEAAILDSPRVQRRLASLREARLELERVEREAGPTVDLSAEALQDVRGEQGLFFGLRAALPLFDNGVRNSRERAARAAVDSAEAALTAETDDLRARARVLGERLDWLAEEVSAKRVVLANARDRLIQTERRFEAEEATFRDMAVAITQYASALETLHTAYTQAIEAQNDQLVELGQRSPAAARAAALDRPHNDRS